MLVRKLNNLYDSIFSPEVAVGSTPQLQEKAVGPKMPVFVQNAIDFFSKPDKPKDEVVTGKKHLVLWRFWRKTLPVELRISTCFPLWFYNLCFTHLTTWIDPLFPWAPGCVSGVRARGNIRFDLFCSSIWLKYEMLNFEHGYCNFLKSFFRKTPLSWPKL